MYIFLGFEDNMIIKFTNHNGKELKRTTGSDALSSSAFVVVVEV
jgi:hypothetical protein